MKRPRFSLGGLMIVVGVVAVEIAYFRITAGRRDLWEALAWDAPLVTILTFGLVQLLRRGKSATPFLLGFEICGWLAAIVWLAAIEFGWPPFVTYLDWVEDSLLDSLISSSGVRGVSEWDELLFWGVFTPIDLTAFTVPPLIPALIGGWLASRLKIAIERRRPADQEPGGGETSSAVSADAGTTLKAKFGFSRVGGAGGNIGKGRDAVKRPRSSLGGLMIVVGVVAAEIVLVQNAIAREDLWEALAVFAPMVTILTVGLVRLLRRGRSATPFLLGFEVCGWSAVIFWYLAYEFDWLPFVVYSDDCMEPLVNAVISSIGLRPDYNLRTEHELAFWIVKVPGILIGVTAPPLILAVVGGWLAQRFQRSRPAGPETMVELTADVGFVPGSTPP